MAAPDQIDELRHRFAVQPRRYFAPLADALRRAGAYEEAVTMLRAQLAELPQHLTGHVVLGQALFDTGALAEARTAFETARALDPGNRVVLRQLGEIASLGGDQTTARLWFGRLRAADPYADDVDAQLGHGAPSPPDADEPSAAEDGTRVAPEREVLEREVVEREVVEREVREQVAPTFAAAEPELPELDAPANFELLEFDPLVLDAPALDPVVGLDLAPDHDAPELERPADLDQIASGPFATETMAGLLAAQGHTDQAVALYERLTAERPGDVALRARLDALRAPPPSIVAAAAAPAAPAPAPMPTPTATPTSRDDDVARGAMLAAGFASLSRRDDTPASPPATAADEPDPYADLSFDRFFVAGVPDATAPDTSPAASAEPGAPPDAPPDAPADADADLARFDAWLRGVAV